MRAAVWWLSLVALSWPTACTVAESFVCSADGQCVTEAAAGRCEPEGVCSFPDDACPSGHRYGELAGALSGTCVGEGEEGSTSEPGTTSATTSAGPTTLDGADATSTSTTTSTSTSTATSTSSTTEPAEETGLPPDPPTSTSTTGDDPNAPYGPCLGDDDCPVAGSICIPTPLGNTVCAPPCDEQMCTYEGMSGASVTCYPIDASFSGCILLCELPEQCPDGMVCEPVEMMGIGVCAWPGAMSP